jgi:outer membrane protein OmpA-like peptidoglycan-associated protein
MKKQIIALLVASLLAGPGWTAEKGRGMRAEKNRATETQKAAGKEETIGLGSGAAIGAIAGGPVGLILGAAFGGWIGDRFHHERSERMTAVKRADEASLRSAALEQRLTGSERQLTAAQSELRSERAAHRENLEQALSVEVYFRTEDSVLGAGTEQRIADLARLVGPMNGAVIKVAGHADARGTPEYNDQLSTRRAESVREALIRGGMPSERILVSASGEAGSTALEQDVDGMALDRRVQIEIVSVDGESQVARTE